VFDEPTSMYQQPDPIAARIPLHAIPGTNHYSVMRR
jgi:hypothetical protein